MLTKFDAEDTALTTDSKRRSFVMLPQITITKTCINAGIIIIVLFYPHLFREQVGAASIAHLCKSILVKNTKCRNEDCSNPKDSLYYLVCVQYVAKLDMQRLYHVIKDLTNGPKKAFHFRVADAVDSMRLTGYPHGAVSPWGMLTNIPIVLDSRILDLQPQTFWLGGGHIDTKLGCQVSEFIEKFNPVVALVTNPRPSTYDGLNEDDDEEQDPQSNDENDKAN